MHLQHAFLDAVSEPVVDMPNTAVLIAVFAITAAAACAAVLLIGQFLKKNRRFEKMTEIKVFTFNLRVESESDGINRFSNRRGRILDCIRQYLPDVIGFQEAKDEMRSWLSDELAAIGYTVVGCGRDADMFGESVIVAFKRGAFIMTDLDNRWLSPTPDVPGSTFGRDQSHCPRIMTAVTLKTRDGNPFIFLNTHLDHKSSTARFLGAVEIMQYLSVRGLHFIITGDMNARPGDPELDPFTNYQPCGETVCDLTEGLGTTFHGFGHRSPDREIKIDYIYSDLPADASKSFVVPDSPVDGVYISDHRPVCAFVNV
ncbi:MAG: endonuclease/exonuclease/phosphatase family protein [Clostridia bacterium]|nr:endonuclease/exonuclease/phosphatase family protein [Clostridia bacterium]